MQTASEFTARDRKLIKRMASDRVFYQERCLFIRDEDGHIIPLRLNRAQRRVDAVRRRLRREGRAVRMIILKARRHGITTQQQADSFHLVSTHTNRQAVTLAHTADATEKIFRIPDTFYEELHPSLRPARLTERNKRNLNYPGMRSLFYIGTAGGRGFGRSDTLQRVHWSEVAWSSGDSIAQKALLVGLTEACRTGEIVLESTANGAAGLFHDFYKRAKEGRGSWEPIFIPWWDDIRNRIHLEVDVTHELVKAYTDEEKDLVRRHGLTPEQIAWRRAKQEEPEYEGDLFFQEYAEDDVTCFLVSGTTWFDMSIIRALQKSVPKPIATRRAGEMEIYEPVLDGHGYVIGCDVGEGLPNSHYSVAAVMDRVSMKQCARLRCRMDPTEFGHAVAALASEYNMALIGVERNNHGHSVLNTLTNTVRYPRIYRHRDYDAQAGTTLKLGWETNPKTKPIMIPDIRTATQKGHMEVRSRSFLDECTTYVHLGDGKYGPQDEATCYDDEIMAWAIAVQIRNSGQSELATPLDQKSLSQYGEQRIYGAGEEKIY